MPDWWLAAVFPSIAFSVMLALWVLLPARKGEWDFGARLRWLLFSERANDGQAGEKQD